MLRITEIVFGLEKLWNHRNRDCMTIPCHLCLVALILGIFTGSNLAQLQQPAFLLLILSTILFWCASLLHRAIPIPHRFHLVTWMICWCMLWFNLGFFMGNDRPHHHMPQDELCHVSGVIQEVPPGSTSVMAIISRFECTSQSGNQHIKLRLKLNCDGKCYRGMTFETTGCFEPFTAPDVPGMFDANSWARSKGISGNFHTTGETRLHDGSPGFRARIEIARNRAFDTLATHSPYGIMPALMLGTSKKISNETRDIFSKIGIAHVLAVSGLHFGFVALLISFVCKKAVSLSPWMMRRFGTTRTATFLSFPVLAIYLLFVGAPISAQRALIMTSACALARILNRKPCRTRALSTAGILILIHTPHAIYDISFQLSLSAMLGIIQGLTFYEQNLRLKILSLDIVPRIKKTITILVSMIIMTVSTALTTAPFVIFHFGQLPVLGILANLPVIPFVTFILMPISILTASFLIIGLPCADWISTAAGHCENLLITFASLTETYVPAACLELPSHPVLIAVSSVTAFCLLFPFRPKTLRVILTVMATVAMSTTLIVSATHPRIWTQPDGLRISFVSMGQADGTLIEFPNGHTMLVDIGTEIRSHDNAAQTRMLPFLKYNMIKHIDILVLTHSDHDHIAGLSELLSHCTIGEVWFNGRDLETPSRYAPIHERKIPFLSVNDMRRHQTIGGTDIDILWPVPQNYYTDKNTASDIPKEPMNNAGGSLPLRVYSQANTPLPPPSSSITQNFLNENESSVVLLIRYGHFSALLMGDAGKQTEQEILAQNFIGHVTVLKAGHHGSNFASSSEWIDSTMPQFTVFSVGKHNQYKFPHLEVQRRFIQNRSRMFRTDIHGTIRMTTNGKNVYIETMRY